MSQASRLKEAEHSAKQTYKFNLRVVLIGGLVTGVFGLLTALMVWKLNAPGQQKPQTGTILPYDSTRKKADTAFKNNIPPPPKIHWLFVRVVDTASKQFLAGVHFSTINGQEGESNADGWIRINADKLGNQQIQLDFPITLSKPGYATNSFHLSADQVNQTLILNKNENPIP